LVDGFGDGRVGDDVCTDAWVESFELELVVVGEPDEEGRAVVWLLASPLFFEEER
jgi:hypothetical protein